jgi:hypothetical protein
MSELQKSINWDDRENIMGFLDDGFPFDEGWPQCGPGETKFFDIITRNGQKHTAYIDFSTQYRAEGLNWFSLSIGSIVSEFTVIAWREKEI